MTETKALFLHAQKIGNLEMFSGNIQAKEFSEKRGRDIYKKFQELRDVCTVMEHPEFLGFYYKYMRDFEKFKRILVLLKLYDLISHKLQEHAVAHNAYHKLFILYNIINNPTYKHILFSSVKLQNDKNRNEKQDNFDKKGEYPAICDHVHQ